MDWRKQMNRLTQMASQGLGRSEKSEGLSATILELEKKLEDVKLVSQKSSNKLSESLLSNAGTDFDKRVRKLPLWSFANTTVEFSSKLNPIFVALAKTMHMVGESEEKLARELIHYEIEVENKVLLTFKNIADRDVPSIQKLRKQLDNYVLDMNSARSRFAKQPSEALRDELDEAKMRVDQAQDQLAAELFSFATREEEFCRLFLTLIEAQSEYHKRSLAILDHLKPSLRQEIDQHVDYPVFKTPLHDHLHYSNREIAFVIEECIKVLSHQALTEEGLFRIAGGKSRVNRLKAAFDANMVHIEEFRNDVHCVADVLKQYLRTLPEPLMTFDLFSEWMSVSQMPADRRLDAIKRILDKLPKANYDNLRYLVKFLALLAEHSEVNKMSPSNLAIVVGPNLLWPKEDRGTNFQVASASIELLITNANWFFPGVLADSSKPKTARVDHHVPETSPISVESRLIDLEVSPGISREVPSSNVDVTSGNSRDLTPHHADVTLSHFKESMPRYCDAPSGHSRDFLPRMKNKFRDTTKFNRKTDKADIVIPGSSSSTTGLSTNSDDPRAWLVRPLRFQSQSESTSPISASDFNFSSSKVISPIEKSKIVRRGHRRVASAGGLHNANVELHVAVGHSTPEQPLFTEQSKADKKTRSKAVSTLAIDFSGPESSSTDSSPYMTRRPAVFSHDVPHPSPATVPIATSQISMSPAAASVDLSTLTPSSSSYGDLTTAATVFPDSERLEDTVSLDDMSPKTTRRRRAPAPPVPVISPPESASPPASRPSLASVSASSTPASATLGHRRAASANTPTSAGVMERPNVPPPAPPRPVMKPLVENGAKSAENSRADMLHDGRLDSNAASKVGTDNDLHETVKETASSGDGSGSNGEEKTNRTAELRAQWFQNNLLIQKDDEVKSPGVAGSGTVSAIAKKMLQSQIIVNADVSPRPMKETSRQHSPVAAAQDPRNGAENMHESSAAMSSPAEIVQNISRSAESVESNSSTASSKLPDATGDHRPVPVARPRPQVNTHVTNTGNDLSTASSASHHSNNNQLIDTSSDVHTTKKSTKDTADTSSAPDLPPVSVKRPPPPIVPRQTSRQPSRGESETGKSALEPAVDESQEEEFDTRL